MPAVTAKKSEASFLLNQLYLSVDEHRDKYVDVRAKIAVFGTGWNIMGFHRPGFWARLLNYAAKQS